VNSLARIPYTLAGRAANALVGVVPSGRSKFRRGLSARRGIVARYQRWASANRDITRPLVWFHAPSVGEGLQALPVIQLLRARKPEAQIAYTFYSPSAEEFARSLDVSFADYLPFDTFDDATAIVSALRPSALVFSKLDIWPALTECAASANIPIGVLSATMTESSGRRGFLAQALLGDAYRAISRVGAIDERAAQFFRDVGVAAEKVEITGDTRYDQVWARANRASPGLVQSLRSSRPTLVSGSTWPSDETHLLAAWVKVRDKIPDARLIIAPHETTAGHLASIKSWARTNNLRLATIDARDASDGDVVLVDRFGILGDLYALADVAYVGGGFHSAGLHSVLEPAAFGAPVLFGPRNEMSADAAKLSEAGGGAAITGSMDLALRLGDWLGSPAAREVAGEAARLVVQEGTGAAERSFALVSSLLDH
jgi:3-deoxy-D-manno-octulosonic-acid transferase